MNDISIVLRKLVWREISITTFPPCALVVYSICASTVSLIFRQFYIFPPSLHPKCKPEGCLDIDREKEINSSCLGQFVKSDVKIKILTNVI